MTVRKLAIIGVCFLLCASTSRAQSDRPSPVTDAILDDPPAADWLHWRHSPEGWGYSPLDQITRENVAELRLVWSWALEPGSQETTPLVHDGVMFLASPGNIIHALDAATGDLLWEYRRQFAEEVRGRGWTLRNLSIYGDKVFVNTADAHLVALDVHTGEVVWETAVADQQKGFTY
ncbi:MAG: PQQ-binding-like beta-propeller repeat protein, partial [Acidobacteria bacterium]|nr:PQQ-binding-like beta-propeller repeat protein [Acidobacteriota bacterium]